METVDVNKLNSIPSLATIIHQNLYLELYRNRTNPTESDLHTMFMWNNLYLCSPEYLQTEKNSPLPPSCKESFRRICISSKAMGSVATIENDYNITLEDTLEHNLSIHRGTSFDSNVLNVIVLSTYGADTDLLKSCVEKLHQNFPSYGEFKETPKARQALTMTTDHKVYMYHAKAHVGTTGTGTSYNAYTYIMLTNKVTKELFGRISMHICATTPAGAAVPEELRPCLEKMLWNPEKQEYFEGVKDKIIDILSIEATRRDVLIKKARIKDFANLS